MKQLFLLLALSLQTTQLASQSVRFYAQADIYEIPVGSYVDVEFVLENADGKNFVAPSLKEFDVISGPNRSSKMSMMNGRVSRSQTFGYSLRPKRVGEFTIGKASIQTSVGKMFTKEISIKVVERQQRSEEDLESVFIKAIISDSVAFVGQQINLSYKLYTQLNVQSVNFVSKTEFEGFYHQNISSNSESTKREIINGVEYATKIVKRVSLFPQQKGSYVIDPALITLGIASERSRRSFFFSSQLERKQVVSNELTVSVVDMPPNAPESFSGAIGSYSMTANVSKRNITTDEAIIIQMSVTGDGDNKTVSPPAWLRSDSLEIYDPNIISDEILSRRRKITHRKEFEYLFVPKYPGQYRLRPEFSYFDPDSQDYRRIYAQLPVINVVPGNRYSNSDNTDKQEVDMALIESPVLRKQGYRIHGSPVHTIFLLLVFLSACTVIAYSLHLKRSGKLDPAQIKRNKAYERALERLNQLDVLLKKDSNSEFYLELASSVKTFISDKYQIPCFHISNKEIIDKLIEKSLGESDINDFKEILKASETALYAPGMAGEPQSLYNLTLDLFTRLDS